MPELPDIVAYIEALRPRILDQPLGRVRLASPFLVRSVDPPLSVAEGMLVRDVRRIGKRIVLVLEAGEGAGEDGDSGKKIFLVFHLMIAGRFRWEKPGARPPGKIGLAAFEFPAGTLVMTEASPKKRASLHVLGDAGELHRHNPGGIELLDAYAWGLRTDLQCGSRGSSVIASQAEFAAALTRESHTLKRALTDPRLFSGIGNAYSDEILHAAGLSPILLTQRLKPEQVARLFAATIETLQRWIALLRAEFGGRFPGPGEITAFRTEFAVHGRFGQPCPVCNTAVQRIRYAENETNYCPRCQTEGRVLADRSLSRLLKDDWPRTVEELENV